MTRGRSDPGLIGDIPFRIRIGVVGDAPVEDLEALRAAVRTGLAAKLDGLFNPRSRRLLGLDDGPARERLTLIRHAAYVCPLAAGERALAEEIARFPDGRVQVVLSSSPHEFLKSLPPGSARDEARQLIERTRVVTVRPTDENLSPIAGGDRAAATNDADRFIVDHSDVVIVLRGDRDPRVEHVLTLARRRKRPVLHLAGQPSPIWTVEIGHGLDARSVARLEMFNRFPVPAAVQEAYTANQLREVLGEGGLGSIPEETIDHLRRHLLPCYVRASLLAKRSRRLYQRAGAAVWCLFPAAVTAVAVGALAPSLAVIAFGLEFALLAGIASIVWYADRKRSHEVWAECRFLTERIRTATYLAACGCEASLPNIPPFGGALSQRDDWMMMAFDEIWGRMPALPGCEAGTCQGIARFAQRQWIGRQVEFHRERAARARRMSRRLEQWGRAAFMLALAIAALHFVLVAFGGHDHHSASAFWMTFFAIAFPAVGAAIGGFRTHREYSRIAKRSANMTQELERLEQRVGDATTPQALHRGLQMAEEMLLSETQDWLMLMQAVPVELPG